ncbi:unnamed protein product [Rotaria sordida]|uniref:ClpA/ClpB AAA lid domain-containing protein n=2 Tax=Rotaria sordida TaxID=392033 RepID=A0A816E407_9BILA|nr:unnamed protein product [Rotaria sordida]CAF0796753.1 unnamed protein product [Rotaria sordida]CAF1470819.1 unnamed protein product [Rotaria sordida]CAF1644917.1 unnamed protein product [Rotaria sordida]
MHFNVITRFNNCFKRKQTSSLSSPVIMLLLKLIRIKEATAADCVSILCDLKVNYESYFGVRILDSALIIAPQLSNRYITNQILPNKVIDKKYSFIKF